MLHFSPPRTVVSFLAAETHEPPRSHLITFVAEFGRRRLYAVSREIHAFGDDIQPHNKYRLILALLQFQTGLDTPSLAQSPCRKLFPSPIRSAFFNPLLVHFHFAFSFSPTGENLVIALCVDELLRLCVFPSYVAGFIWLQNGTFSSSTIHLTRCKIA